MYSILLFPDLVITIQRVFVSKKVENKFYPNINGIEMPNTQVDKSKHQKGHWGGVKASDLITQQSESRMLKAVRKIIV